MRNGRAFTHPAMAQSESTLAPAKINLTLRIFGRRGDGFHELESLVAFAPFGDRLTLWPDGPLDLEVSGATAAGAGPLADNLVLRAARALAARIEGLRLGRFALVKRLPSGAGLGGGSSDAAAALRLIARSTVSLSKTPAFTMRHALRARTFRSASIPGLGSCVGSARYSPLLSFCPGSASLSSIPPWRCQRDRYSRRSASPPASNCWRGRPPGQSPLQHPSPMRCWPGSQPSATISSRLRSRSRRKWPPHSRR